MELIIVKIVGAIAIAFALKRLVGRLVLWYFLRKTDKQIQEYNEELTKKQELTQKEKEDYEKAIKEFNEFLDSLNDGDKWKRKGPRSGEDH